MVFGGDPFVDILCQTKIVVNYFGCEMRYRLNRSMVEYIAGSSDLRRNVGLRISNSVVMILGGSLHLLSMKPTWALKKRNLNYTDCTVL